VYLDADADSSLLPEAGTYEFAIGAAQATLNFTVNAPNDYQVHLVVTESDRTQTLLWDTVTAGYFSSEYDVFGAVKILSILNTTEGPFLRANEENIMSIGDIDHYHFTDTDLFRYQNNIVYSHDNPLHTNLSTLFFCDNYTIYTFYSYKNNPIQGRGVLFVNQGMGAALYFSTPNFTTPNFFEEVISQLEYALHIEGSGVDEAPANIANQEIPEEEEEEEEETDESSYTDSSVDEIPPADDGSTDHRGPARFRRSSSGDSANGLSPEDVSVDEASGRSERSAEDTGSGDWLLEGKAAAATHEDGSGGEE
jgi:hypothetical protein